MVEANAVIEEEIVRVKGEQNPRLHAAPPPVEVDYEAMRDFYNEHLPPGQRPNLSPHQAVAFLQKERDSLDILASRLREKLDDLAAGAISAEQFTRSLSWQLTAPLRRLVDLLRR